MPEVATGAEGVVPVRLETRRGWALYLLGRYSESACTYLAAATAAERMGWLGWASTQLSRAGSTFMKAEDFAKARSAYDREVELRAASGDRPGEGGRGS